MAVCKATLFERLLHHDVHMRFYQRHTSDFSKTKNLFFLLLVCIFSLSVNAQKATIIGKVQDEDRTPVSGALVRITPELYTFTDSLGNYRIQVDADGNAIQIEIRHISFQAQIHKLTPKPNETMTRIFTMSYYTFEDQKVQGEKHRDIPMVNINPENIQVIATPGDKTMALLKTIGMGIASNNELSSSYSVRGGNFDENMIYVNDVEVYRPFLARSGQQEGLSFINADMISTMSFSAGGFEAKYGDKMSSVLDITYRRPYKFGATVSASFLGVNAHVEDALFKRRLKYVMGFRYKSNNYILSGLDTKGAYKPNFIDFQSMVTFDITDRLEIMAMGMYSDNNYHVIPQDRTTQFGHAQDSKQLRVFYEGEEKTRFKTGTGALVLNFHPTKTSFYKFIGSYYDTKESENFDVLGEYFLGEIEKDLNSPDFGEVVNTVGYGGFLNHARNTLHARVATAEFKSQIFREGRKNADNSMTISFGAKYQREMINDRLDEWNMLDSSGYSLPYNPWANENIELLNVKKTTIDIASNRASLYYQHNFIWYKNNNRVALTGGVRGQYWDLNKEFIWSPRAQLSWAPHIKQDIVFRAAGGIYYQAPFYRELRDLQGNINADVKSQRSIQAILGMDFNFKIWGRPFKFVAEAYYKYLTNINPYKLEDVRIRYYAKNNAIGYAAGLDLKVGGEFVEGLQSWFNLSIMGTQEDILDDFYFDEDGKVIHPGFIPRPTDQRVIASIFFQDHIPKLKSVRVHLNLLFGSKLPFGPPGEERYMDVLRAPFYRRVDIGFSYVILQPDRVIKRPNSVMRYVKTMWVSFEIFNIFDINNTISYTWIADVSGRKYAVPNYLTPRLFNLQFFVKF